MCVCVYLHLYKYLYLRIYNVSVYICIYISFFTTIYIYVYPGAPHRYFSLQVRVVSKSGPADGVLAAGQVELKALVSMVSSGYVTHAYDTPSPQNLRLTP